MAKSHLEAIFAAELAQNCIEFVREYKFHDKRRWRADFALLDVKLLIEIEGGIWTNGGHTRGSGYEKDCEKYATAILDGYTVLRFTGNQVKNGFAIDCVKKFIHAANCST